MFIFDLFSFLTPYLLLPLTWSLVLCSCQWSSAIKYSSDFRKHSLHLYSTIDRPLIYIQLPCSYGVGFRFICIVDPRSIACSNQPGPWSSAVVTGFLISNLPLIFEKFPCTCTLQLIDP